MGEKALALRLADQMLHYWDERGPDAEEVAAELRRLHAVNAELLEALKEIMSWEENDEMTWGPVARAAIAKAEGV